MTMPSEVFGGTSVKKRALTNKHFLAWKMLLKTDNLLPFVCFHILYITILVQLWRDIFSSLFAHRKRCRILYRFKRQCGWLQAVTKTFMKSGKK